MIHTIRTVAVGDQESKIDSPIILYRGDREVEVEFTINGSKFTFTNGGNVIKSTNATHGQLVINTPTGENMFSEVTECHDGKVVFVITKEMIDELIEVGFYSFQIRLFDESQVSRVTIPPVLKGIDIRNPIAAEDETNVVDIALVDYAVVVKDEFEDLSTFLPDGNYNKTEWESKDVISGAKLNKIEDALYNINSNMEASDFALLNRVENINKTIHGEIDKLGNELESEVEEFERELNNNVELFKIDTNAAMAAHKNEVSEELESVNSQLDHIKKETMIYPDEFEGTDTEKIQQAFNRVFDIYANTSVMPCIIINRDYILNTSIYYKNDDFWDYIPVKGEGGTLTQNFNGFMFESYADNRSRHAPLFENIRFRKTDNVTMACVINGDKFIRAMFDKCNFYKISCVNADGYLQTLRLHNCEIGGNLTTHFIKANMCYDGSIVDCRFEQQTSSYSAIYIMENGSGMNISYMSLRIISSLFEGYYQSPAIQLGSGYGLVINGCYFESNKGNIIFSKVANGNGIISGQITGCTFMTTKSDDGYSINFNSMNVSKLLVDYNTTNDNILSNVNIRKNNMPTMNFPYAGGVDFKKTGTVTTRQNADQCKLIIKRDPIADDGRLLFKFPTPWWADLHNNVTGAFLISITFGYGSSSLYRGAVTILVHTGSCWIDGKMTKIVNYSVLGGMATESNNGSNGTDFDSINLFWNETGSRKTDSVEDTRYISVSIKNTDETRLSLCSGSIMHLGNVICDTWEVIE